MDNKYRPRVVQTPEGAEILEEVHKDTYPRKDRSGYLSIRNRFEVADNVKSHHPDKYLGRGIERVVFEDNGEVIAITYHSVLPEQAHVMFYSNKIFTTLFPHNFPDLSQIYAGDHAIERRFLIKAAPNRRVEHPFKDIRQKLEEMGIYNVAKPSDPTKEFITFAAEPLETPSGRNTITGIDKFGEVSELFCDAIYDIYPNTWNLKKLHWYMVQEAHGYSRMDIKRVFLALKRLNVALSSIDSKDAHRFKYDPPKPLIPDQVNFINTVLNDISKSEKTISTLLD